MPKFGDLLKYLIEVKGINIPESNGEHKCPECGEVLKFSIVGDKIYVSCTQPVNPHTLYSGNFEEIKREVEEYLSNKSIPTTKPRRKAKKKEYPTIELPIKHPMNEWIKELRLYGDMLEFIRNRLMEGRSSSQILQLCRERGWKEYVTDRKKINRIKKYLENEGDIFPIKPRGRKKTTKD
jgi:hypothetical protein